jgi:glycosyltransferase involved in cell wall biosynthesis
VIGADSGGLPDAIGPCGPIIPKSDPAALAAAIDKVTTDTAALAAYRQHMPAHLAKFTKAVLMNSCEAVIREVGDRFNTVANGRRRPH